MNGFNGSETPQIGAIVSPPREEEEEEEEERGK